MIITVITVCLNSEKTIEQTIRSVIGQTYNNIEYIIWDGGSTDSTIDIVGKFLENSKNIKLYRGVDSGPGDAFNKSIELAKGDIVGFLASDDIYYTKSVLEDIFFKFKENNSLGAVYGDIVYQNKNGAISRKWITGKYSEDSFLNGWAIPFPSFYFKRKYYSLYGGMDLDMDIADDFDLILRYVFVNKIKILYINKTMIIFSSTGRSSSIFARFKSLNEILYSFKKYNIKINLFNYVFKRYLAKIKQLFI